MDLEMAATQCGMYDICHLTECNQNHGSQTQQNFWQCVITMKEVDERFILI